LEEHKAGRTDRNVAANRHRAGREPGLRRVRRATAATVSLLAITALAVTGAASSSALAAPRTVQPAIPAWRIVRQVHSGPESGFSVVIAAGRNGGWAFNRGSGTSGPTAWRRSGSNPSTWTQVAFPGKSDEFVVAARAISASDVWAFTASLNQSRVLRWDGRAWTVKRTFSREIAGAAVISPSDIWVFGQPFVPGPGLGAWHYDGRTWSRVASGHNLEGGSALSGHNVWAFDGTGVAHWNGSTWSRTSVARLLPGKQQLNDPMLTGILALSSHNVYAIANGFRQDEGGPMALLHWDGHQWSRVAGGNYGFGGQPLQQMSSDGHGGLWIPMPGTGGQKSYLLHYSAGHLTTAALPGGPNRITVGTVALIPGTSGVLAGGTTHAFANPGANVTAVLLQYEV
jgi:hypothetical protein